MVFRLVLLINYYTTVSHQPSGSGWEKMAKMGLFGRSELSGTVYRKIGKKRNRRKNKRLPEHDFLNTHTHTHLQHVQPPQTKVGGE